ncbi:MAG: DNA polymerase III subunit [Candidatus Omnitrophica bacterium]|nr:DNA polymerase III subunit [Candidatus Omnitrophota bacterium]
MPADQGHLIHNNILERFARLNTSGRLAHAYLFVGPAGIGKRDTARAVAKLVNCLAPGGFRPGCDCASCRKTEAGNHPDVYVVHREADRQELRAELIRDLMERFNLRVWEGRMRVGIILNAEDMNTVAQSVFLKTLEEPAPKTLLILTASQSGLLLPTIVSRCQPVYFFQLGYAELAEWIKNEYHVEPVEAAALARFGQGSPGRVRELGPGFLGTRNGIIDEFIMARDGESAVKAYCADRDSARIFLEVILTFFRDVTLIRRGLGAEYLIHADRIEAARTLAARYSDEDLDRIVEQAVSAIRGAGEYMNVKVAVMLLKELMRKP